jgi:hypothetical protein
MTGERPAEANAQRRPGEPREGRRLVRPALDVERCIEFQVTERTAELAKLPIRLSQPGRPSRHVAPPPKGHGDDLVDDRVVVEDDPLALFGKPDDPGFGLLSLDGRGDRERVDDVAERGEPDDGEAPRSRGRRRPGRHQ